MPTYIYPSESKVEPQVCLLLSGNLCSYSHDYFSGFSLFLFELYVSEVLRVIFDPFRIIVSRLTSWQCWEVPREGTLCCIECLVCYAPGTDLFLLSCFPSLHDPISPPLPSSFPSIFLCSYHLGLSSLPHIFLLPKHFPRIKSRKLFA